MVFAWILINKNLYKRKSISILFITGIIFFQLVSCSSDSSSKKVKKISSSEKTFYDNPGIGPIKELTLNSTLNSEMTSEGEKVFQSKCVTCHKISDERGIGPGLKGITQRRRPEWIMNQILNPLEMTQKDSMSKELFSIYMSQMTDMDLTENDARNVLEYFRKIDK